ncbi:hypothetical protein D3C81_1190580 [compost metagenome]
MPGHRTIRVLRYPADDPQKRPFGVLAQLQGDHPMDTLAQQKQLARCHNTRHRRHDGLACKNGQQAQVVLFVEFALDPRHTHGNVQLGAQAFFEHALHR